MSEENSDLGDRIGNVANDPLKAANQSGSVENHNLRDMIEADKYLQSKASANRKRGLGIRLGRITPGGTV
tara:strand:- start:103 stop:312 length:210 start_codon:yes stop_codon:yes gene_type:complete